MCPGLVPARLAREHLPALNMGACAVPVAIVSFFRDNELDALDFYHPLAPCFDIRLSDLRACLCCLVCSARFSIPGALALGYLLPASAELGPAALILGTVIHRGAEGRPALCEVKLEPCELTLHLVPLHTVSHHIWA